MYQRVVEMEQPLKISRSVSRFFFAAAPFPIARMQPVYSACPVYSTLGERTLPVCSHARGSQNQTIPYDPTETHGSKSTSSNQGLRSMHLGQTSLNTEIFIYFYSVVLGLGHVYTVPHPTPSRRPVPLPLLPRCCVKSLTWSKSIEICAKTLRKPPEHTLKQTWIGGV